MATVNYTYTNNGDGTSTVQHTVTGPTQKILDLGADESQG